MSLAPGFDRRTAEPAPQKTANGTAFRTFGEGEPLVLMHGGAGSWLHWVRNVDTLAERFRVIALDLPSYGDSDRVEWSISTDEYLGTVADAVMEVCGDVPRVHLAGFSFGGMVSAATAVALGPLAAFFETQWRADP